MCKNHYGISECCERGRWKNSEREGKREGMASDEQGDGLGSGSGCVDRIFTLTLIK